MSESRPALFPARATLPDGSDVHPVRVATGNDRVTRVWAWDHSLHDAVELAAWPADQVERADGLVAGRPRALRGPDGTVVDGRNAGCGCGHPLKAWRPPAIAA